MITNEDCMDLMARYEDNYFDLAIVDPPYGLERFKKGEATLTNMEQKIKIGTILNQLKSILMNFLG